LIRDGATLVTKLEDILDDLGPLPAEAMEESSNASEDGQSQAIPENPPVAEPSAPISFNLSESQQTILDHLDGDPQTIDTLIDRTGLDASIIMRDLTYLTLKGAVQREAGQTYRRAR
jgi:predicted Rossmann fold nucleotide-binding protein DprA/Smf involved in DNA uptake